MGDCPACLRGQLKDGVCQRCGVGVARGSSSPVTVYHTHPRRRPDQDRTSGLTDHARYKEDHRED